MVFTTIKGSPERFIFSRLTFGAATEQAVVLADLQSIADVACLYPESLIKAYPRAKVILCYRDPDKWAASIDATLVQLVTGWAGTLVRLLAEPLTGTFGITMRWDVLRAWFEVGTVASMLAAHLSGSR